MSNTVRMGERVGDGMTECVGKVSEVTVLGGHLVICMRGVSGRVWVDYEE